MIRLARVARPLTAAVVDRCRTARREVVVVYLENWLTDLRAKVKK